MASPMNGVFGLSVITQSFSVEQLAFQVSANNREPHQSSVCYCREENDKGTVIPSLPLSGSHTCTGKMCIVYKMPSTCAFLLQARTKNGCIIKLTDRKLLTPATDQVKKKKKAFLRSFKVTSATFLKVANWIIYSAFKRKKKKVLTHQITLKIMALLPSQI